MSTPLKDLYDRPFLIRLADAVHAEAPGFARDAFLRATKGEAWRRLEALKADPSAYVRRSVANNLNDIAKDHPDVTLAVAGRWLGRHAHTDALVKHACRTLLKKGDPRALALFGYGHEVPATVEALAVSRTKLSKGDTLEFSFVVSHDGPGPASLRIEYHLHFARPSGATSKKVFQVAERTLPPGAHTFTRRYTFVDRTIRVHYPGQHRLAIVVNGAEKASAMVHLAGDGRDGRGR